MRVLRVAVAVLLVGLVAGAAGAKTIAVDFARWDLSQWLPVRQAEYPKVVPFVQGAGYIENYLPPGASEQDIEACKNGLGVAVMLLRGVPAGDLTVRCETAFDRKGAPAINFRTQHLGGVTGATYSLVLYEKGINLWKYSGGKWSKVGATEFAVSAGEFHEVRLYARGVAFRVYVDGRPRLSCRDAEPLPAGGIGLWSGEGPCRFRSLRAWVPDRVPPAR
jgi:hypothetical protein